MSETNEISAARRLVQIHDCAMGGHAPTTTVREFGSQVAVRAYCECNEVEWRPVVAAESSS